MDHPRKTLLEKDSPNTKKYPLMKKWEGGEQFKKQFKKRERES